MVRSKIDGSITTEKALEIIKKVENFTDGRNTVNIIKDNDNFYMEFEDTINLV